MNFDEMGPNRDIGVSTRRIGILLGIFAIAFLIVFARTVYLQSIKTRVLSKWATHQQQEQMSLPAVRGGIFDRNGQQLAVGEAAVTFYATPKLVKDPIETALQISKMLELKATEKDKLIADLTNTSSGFLYVARQVPRKQAEPLIKAKIDGIGYYEEEKRYYPLHQVGAQLIGFAGTDNHGLAGVEMLYDNTLSGRPGKQVIVRDPLGTPIDVLSLQREQDGRDVQLTIDGTIQTEAERILTETTKKFSAQGATAIVMNPRNGEIYAMANVPGVDANIFGDSNSSWQRNRAITDTYEPGSTFKVVTIGGALEDGIVTPTLSYVLKPKIKVADRVIKDAENRPTERMSVRDILVQSSNVGTITIAHEFAKPHNTNEVYSLRRARERLDYWMRKFGFGSNSGIDFPGEVPGLMLHPNEWSGSTIGNVPIGQGVGVTAMQLANAYAAIANDGVMVQPHILKHISGETPPIRPKKRVISEKTARTLRYILGQVVTDERGTGNFAKIEGYRVAGKTGTANKAQGGIYVKGKYSSSFIGFVPANNPQLLTLVVVDEPNVPWGGTVAAPAFEQITEFALQYLAIPPDGVM